MKQVVLLLHNIRSTHNVGSIMRTAEGFGVTHICFSGYTPYPLENLSPKFKLDFELTSGKSELRLPHIADKLTKQISKTALDAEKLVPFTIYDTPPIALFKAEGFRIVALEQADNSINIRDYQPQDKTLLILGEEVEGINQELLSQVDDIIEIPMVGRKESFNVSVAAGIALYKLCT